MKVNILEAVLYRCSWEKVFWKYPANLQENTHATCEHSWILKATLLKSLWCGCFPVNLLHFFRIPFAKKTSGVMFLTFTELISLMWIKTLSHCQIYLTSGKTPAWDFQKLFHSLNVHSTRWFSLVFHFKTSLVW